MDIEEIDLSEFKTKKVNLKDVVMLTLHRWRWLALSLIVCVGLALFSVLRAVPLYERTSQLLIKESTMNGSFGSELSVFSDLGVATTNTMILDEINKLQSPDLMAEVVQRLNLRMNYQAKGLMHPEVLYGTRQPVTVDMDGVLPGESASLRLQIDESGKITISKFVSNDEKIKSEPREIKFFDSVPTPVGPVCVRPNPAYKAGEKYDIIVSKSTRKGAVRQYCGKFTTKLLNDYGGSVDLKVIDASPERAEAILRTVVEVYNDNWLANRNRVSTATSEFITSRLSVIESELGNVDSQISSYQSRNRIPNVGEAASIYMRENQAAEQSLFEITNQQQMARYIRSYLAESSNRNQLLPANSGIGSQAIETQIGNYNQKMLQRNQYAANSSEQNPMVENLDSQLAGMRRAILSAIDNQIVALDHQLASIQKNLRTTEAQIAASPKQANYLLSVERQQKVKESLYLYLLQKREENELSQAFLAYNTEVIISPNGPSAPISPRTVPTLFMAFVIGLIIPFGVTYLQELTNSKVRDRRDFHGMSLPLVGEIPMMPGNIKHQENTPVVKPGQRDVVNEAFRVLRSNLSFINEGHEGATAIMFTSYNPASGKTFMSVNLALSLALRHKKVLVIDADLRRRSTSKYLGNPPHGFSDYLIGRSNDPASLVKSLAENVDILPVGKMPPNPTELLESERLGQIMEWARKHYDYILVDCPPVNMMADAQIVSRYVDRTFFIVRAGLLEKSLLAELEELYKSKKYPAMAAIINAVEIEKAYGYGYGYGYGNYSRYASASDDN